MNFELLILYLFLLLNVMKKGETLVDYFSYVVGTYILAALEMKLFRNSFPKFQIKETRNSLQSVLLGPYLTHKLKEKIGIPI